MKPTNILLMSLMTLLLAAGLSAQTAISARAGLVNVADGEVFLAGKAVDPKPAELVQIGKGELIQTAEGRAEVLLTPGSFLRMTEQSEFTLDRTDLEDVCLTLKKGTILIEVAELLEGNMITVKMNDAEVRLSKSGLYRFSSDPMTVRVYDGEAVLKTAAGEQKLKKSREMVASANGWTAGKFDTDDTDYLHRWSRRRSEYVAMANRSSAREASSFLGSWGGRTSGWYFNPYFGTYTFMPMFSTVGSPFGYMYYTPYTIYRAYQPQPSYGGGGGRGASSGPVFAGGVSGGAGERSGSRGISSGGGGIISTGASAPAASSAPSSGGGVRGGASGRGGRQ
ncbi:MAG: FecR domain-containing protein [Bryobacteraceae bacterium]|nr:FecR domain-containing protein [Bryobacteraceae bacterium]